MRTCKHCGAVLPKGCDRCLICGLEPGGDISALKEAAPPEPAAALRLRAAAEKAAREHPRRLVSFGLALCLLLSAAAAGVWLYGFLPTLAPGNLSPARGAVFYVTADNALKFINTSGAPQELASGYSAELAPGSEGKGYAKASPSGRYAAYVNNVTEGLGELYLRNFSAPKTQTGELPPDILIARGVVPDSFFFAQSGAGLVFLDGEARLCYTDYREVFVLDTGVAEILAHSESQTLYARLSGGERELCAVETDSNSRGPVLLGDNFESLADQTEDLQKLIYIRQNSDFSRDIVACDLKENTSQIIAVGIDGLLAADAGSVSALYRTKAQNTFDLASFIDDEFAAGDEALTEPTYDKYPGLREFYENMELDTDDEPVVEEEPVPEDVPGAADGEEAGAAPITDELAEEIEMYNADVLRYEQKLDRDGFRAEASDALEEFLSRYPSLYTLHLYRAGSAVKLASNSLSDFDGAELNAAAGVCAWVSTELAGFEKTSMLDYHSRFSVGTPLEYLLGLVGDNLYVQRDSDAPVGISMGSGAFTAGGWRFTQRADGIFFAMADGGPGLRTGEPTGYTLYYTVFFGDRTVVQMDRDVSALGEMLDGNRLLYYKELNGDICDLYLMDGLVPERIGDRASLLPEYLRVENGGRTLLYTERFNSETMSGNLYMLAGQNRQLATDVNRVFYRGDNLVYFLRGSTNAGPAGLYAYGSHGLVQVDSNILYVLE